MLPQTKNSLPVFGFFTKSMVEFSPKVASQVDTIELDEMQYAEVSIDGGEAVPTLMVVGDMKQHVKRTLGAGLLR